MNHERKIERLKENLASVLIGKAAAVKMVLVALFSRGHLLIEDVPGVGKTVLARATARSIDCSFNRIQFTPDLLPNDILGVSIYNTNTGEFDFKPGPIFANVILADEINRASPRTQSSLLEAMNDFQVSVDGNTMDLPFPFMVVATQNSVEYEGTYPLPESQLDRFLMRIDIGYPGFDDEKRVLKSQQFTHPLETLGSVIQRDEVLKFQDMVRGVRVDESLMEYILNIVGETRKVPELVAGVSPRGSLALYRASQALAFIEGRDYCIPDDVKRLAPAILAHRLIFKRRSKGTTGEAAHERIEEILGRVNVPV